MSAEVHEFGGKKVMPEEERTALETLKDLIARIESGEVRVSQWYLMYDEVEAASPGTIRANWESSPMSIATAVYMLEAEKARIMRRTFK